MAAIFVCFSGYSQGGSYVRVKLGISNLMSEVIPENDERIVAYRVEERINMNFGGRITTYTVPHLSMISTVDLGPNNSRKITPVYGKIKINAITMEMADFAVPVKSIPLASAKVRIEAVKAKEVVKWVNIDLIDTYERTLEKGYKSVDMLRRVANARYFEGNLVKSAKWYTQLFEATNNLEPEFYFRFSRSLSAVNQHEKAKEMMRIYEAKK